MKCEDIHHQIDRRAVEAIALNHDGHGRREFLLISKTERVNMEQYFPGEVR
jgi:hypothetical protein